MNESNVEVQVDVRDPQHAVITITVDQMKQMSFDQANLRSFVRQLQRADDDVDWAKTDWAWAYLIGKVRWHLMPKVARGSAQRPLCGVSLPDWARDLGWRHLPVLGAPEKHDRVCQRCLRIYARQIGGQVDL
jgi:hypothetical protein